MLETIVGLLMAATAAVPPPVQPVQQLIPVPPSKAPTAPPQTPRNTLREPPLGQGNGHQYNTYGVGVTQCPHIRQVSDDALYGWLGGYITGINLSAMMTFKQTMDITSGAEIDIIVGYVKATCARKPSISIADSAAQVIGEMWLAQTNKQNSNNVQFR